MFTSGSARTFDLLLHVLEVPEHSVTRATTDDGSQEEALESRHAVVAGSRDGDEQHPGLVRAPIIVRDRLIGVLCVCNAADGLPFTQTDFSLVAALAERHLQGWPLAAPDAAARRRLAGALAGRRTER